MTQGLNVGRLVSVTVNLAPLAAARRGFGTLLVAGDSNVIDGSERFRTYVDLESVAGDFGTSAPEYQAASLYFGQSPRPQQLMIGRWIRTATAALLKGGILTVAEQALANWTAITSGSFKVTIDGTEKTVTGLNFSAVTNLNGVASAINAVLTGGTVAWDGSRFTVTSVTTGAASSVGYASAAATGTDISGLLKLTASTALAPVPGFDAETPVQATAIFANQSGMWYGLSFAASAMPTADQLIAVGEFIEGASITRIFGVTETDTRVLDATYTDDLASRFKALNYKRTCVQYSPNKYAICSLMGRAFSVNFAANRSTITLMYKQEPGVMAELLSETQAQALKFKRCNVFVRYQNDTAIIQYGVMSGQAYFDEIHGLDWFADALQNAEYNLLYQSKTKIPQTDAGQNQLVNVASGVCQEAINNGLIAPGQWNADGFGQIERGDFLTEGFYIYTPPMASQDQSIREQRIAPPIQIALKLAGAIHEIDCIVDVNR
jgi:hypothetical protein